MPFVCDRELDSWARLRTEGVEVVTPEEATTMELPELRIGFLNMMPDRALRATERQFLRLLSAGADECLIHVLPFTVNGLDREGSALRYTREYYEPFNKIRSTALDGLVLTGANPSNPNLREESFWEEFEEVMIWADASVPTIMCSCLATHAVLNLFHGIERSRCLPGKRWGVYSHERENSDHPLLVDMEFEFDAPRSHVYEMTAKQLESSGLRVLAFSEDADFHIATSSDGFKWIFLQGHPEYDAVSLLKEFNREVQRFVAGTRSDYPEFPFNYLNNSAKYTLNEYRVELIDALANSSELPDFPEILILPYVRNTWKDHGMVLFRNWLRSMIRNQEANDVGHSLAGSA